jgi:hypothetical protein
VSHQFEVRIAEQVCDIVSGAGKKIVDTQYVVAAFDQSITKVRTHETRPSGYQDA